MNQETWEKIEKELKEAIEPHLDKPKMMVVISAFLRQILEEREKEREKETLEEIEKIIREMPSDNGDRIDRMELLDTFNQKLKK